MNETEFKARMRRMRGLTSEYAAGYIQGLRRLYHGDAFGTEAEHAMWMEFGLNGDHRTELGRGYRDGFAGADPTPRRVRPKLAPDDKRRSRSIWLTDADWDRLKEAGGARWIEDQLDAISPSAS